MKTAVITGGSSGIGKATAAYFAQKGWRVFEWSRSGTSTESVTHIACDVTSPEATQAAAREVIDQTGVIDVFISNAGFGISGAVEFTTSEDAHRQLEAPDGETTLFDCHTSLSRSAIYWRRAIQTLLLPGPHPAQTVCQLGGGETLLTTSIMRRYLLTLWMTLLTSMAIQAQYVVSDKYDLWFEDTDYEMTTRKPEYCTEHYQDLRNGCQVRLSGRKVYVYRNGYSILYGDEINVLYNGYYRVRRGSTWYLADEDGDLVDGIYGKEILYYPWGYVTIQRSSGYWDIYHCSGRKVETYSYEIPQMFRNGYFCVKQGRYWYAVNENGDKISGVYGDEIILLPNGTWKCVRGNYVSYVE